MLTNKFSIEWLRGVVLSSIVFTGYQDNFWACFFFFFDEKILNVQKRKPDQNQLTKQNQANKKQQR